MGSAMSAARDKRYKPGAQPSAGFFNGCIPGLLCHAGDFLVEGNVAINGSCSLDSLLRIQHQVAEEHLILDMSGMQLT